MTTERKVGGTLVALAAMAGLAASAGTGRAVPLKTKAGNPIANYLFFPGGVPKAKLKEGSAKETGQGPPPKVTTYAAEDQFTAAKKKEIRDKDKADHPSIAFVDDPDVGYDCHGFTFKSGKLWIDDDQVDTILKDQGWKDRAAGGAKVGDIVVYRDAKGAVKHTGVVREVNAKGEATRVESKWGAHGRYVHDLTDVPAGYGTPTVMGGGDPLTDPPLDPEDVNVFNGHTPPPLKDDLRETLFNDFPIPELQVTIPGVVVGPDFKWQYGFDLFAGGVQVTSGDAFSLFGDDLTGATATGDAALAAYGGWQVEFLSPTEARFRAGTSAFIPYGSVPLVDGFCITSSYGGTGSLVYTESVAGSVGRLDGPSRFNPQAVPAPPGWAAAAAGAAGLAAARARRRRVAPA